MIAYAQINVCLVGCPFSPFVFTYAICVHLLLFNINLLLPNCLSFLIIEAFVPILSFFPSSNTLLPSHNSRLHQFDSFDSKHNHLLILFTIIQNPFLNPQKSQFKVHQNRYQCTQSIMFNDKVQICRMNMWGNSHDGEPIIFLKREEEDYKNDKKSATNM